MHNKLEHSLVGLFVSIFFIGCSGSYLPEKPLVPSLEYSKKIYAGERSTNAHEMVQERYEETINGAKKHDSPNRFDPSSEMRAALDPNSQHQLQPYGPPDLNPKDYNGPLSLGDPGQQSSLWRESGTNHDFFRDVRAWQPMDLLTITITEKTEGKKEADTEVKGKSSVKAAISNLLGFEADFTKSNPDADLSSLVGASTQNDFKGEGETTRKDSLKGNISAMVVDVLPTGILRVEGTKIISVNNEEQIMVLTGLVRPRDITSDNVVDSSRVANMRIDYYGRGQLGDVQREGWLGRALRTVWPF